MNGDKEGWTIAIILLTAYLTIFTLMANLTYHGDLQRECSTEPVTWIFPFVVFAMFAIPALLGWRIGRGND